MLLAGHDAVDLINGTTSPWLDHTIQPIDQVIAELDAQTTRRCIKTHTPLDGLPLDGGVRYITVYRHPIDVHFSMRKFISIAIQSKLKVYYGEDVSADFQRFLDGGLDGGDLDMPSLSAIVRHYEQSIATKRENVLVLHYADMLQNPEKADLQIDAHIGTMHPPEIIAAVLAATSFDSMKANAHRFTPNAGTGVWKDDAAFFDTTSSHKWAGRLNNQDMTAYDRKMAQLLSPEARRWLEEGSKQGTSKERM
jgi:aryl sulfotransferase